MAPPLPAGWRLRPAAGLQLVRDGEVLLGGSPLRVLRLSARATTLVSGWLAGQPVGDSVAERSLARRLLDAGLADPDPPPRAPEAIHDVTVVVPVYADPERLRTCLAPLAGGPSVIVVDDGSPEPDPIAAVAHEAGARYVRHSQNLGPSAARNTGLQAATTPLVAFLDADCVPPAGFPGRLLDHLADPAVGLVAPRITSSDRGRGPIAAYERSRSALDMGRRPARVRPYSTVWYVPSAAMLARRTALGRGFDEGLVLGEDVDLVWRLHDAGWQVRYDPAVIVAHEDRVRPAAWLRRRVAYNESVAPLLTRHPERVPVLFLSPPAALTWATSLGGGSLLPLLALTGVRAVRLRRALAGYVPRATSRAGRISLEITVREGRDLARAVAGPWAPFALAALLAAPSRRRRLAGRVGALLGAMAIGDWLADRPALDPFSYGALRLADESTRGLGIWLGCLRAQDFRGLLPRRPPPPSRR
ncbi:MAG TPA: mycofactocin biosynthesis glycosyltransferase MftF [Solirubrobacteraceae bacterium]|nr:mycofactocin biosynthesis glycosyltransferase MftF [Solirubrobacteraceae bacterium]